MLSIIIWICTKSQKLHKTAGDFATLMSFLCFLLFMFGVWFFIFFVGYSFLCVQSCKNPLLFYHTSFSFWSSADMKFKPIRKAKFLIDNKCDRCIIQKSILQHKWFSVKQWSLMNISSGQIMLFIFKIVNSEIMK